LRIDLVGQQQLLHGVGATIVCLTLCEPGFADLLFQCHSTDKLLLAGLQPIGVTLNLFVIVHAVERIFTFKLRPFFALPQHQQPIIAQSVFLVSAAVSVQELFHLSV
jgi:hypothetical protein